MWIGQQNVKKIVQQQVGFQGEGEDDMQVRYTAGVLNILLMCFFFIL